jgi:phage terminase large subunit-like protein
MTCEQGRDVALAGVMLAALLSSKLADLADLTPRQRRDWLMSLPAEVRRNRLPYLWEFWARPAQVWRPGAEMITLYQAGRGWGKTRVGAEAVRWVAENPERCGFGRPPLDERAPIIALVGRTAGDALAQMIRGQTGILAVSPPWFKPRFKPSERLLVWPNGVRAYYFSAETPEQLRGPNIGFAWADEVAFYKQPRGFEVDALENLEHALRRGLGKAIYTTTPKPTAKMIGLHERANRGKAVHVQIPAPREAASDGAPPPTVDEVSTVMAEVISGLPPDVRIVRGSSLDNAANQLATWVALQKSKRGTRIGRQEVEGELLTGNPRTRFTYEMLNARRIDIPQVPRLPDETWQDYVRRVLRIDRLVVAGDPAGTEGEGAEFGVSIAATSRDGREYTLADLSGHHGPFTWPELIYDAAIVWRADAIVGEANYGGNMIRGAIETHVRGLAARGITPIPVPFVEVTAGKGGKAARFEIFAQAMEAGLVYQAALPGEHHQFATLEAQLHAFDPSEHPDKQVARVEVRQPDGSLKTEMLLLDRADARVWAHLFLSGHEFARGDLFMIGADAMRRGVDMMSSLK